MNNLQCASAKGFQMTWNLDFDLESLLATLEMPEIQAEKGKCVCLEVLTKTWVKVREESYHI